MSDDTTDRKVTLQDLIDVRDFIKAKDSLLVAHRVGSSRRAASAIDRLDTLAHVPKRLDHLIGGQNVN